MRELNQFQYKSYMNNFNKKEILEYVRTILIALILALVIASVATACSKVIAEHHARLMSKISNTTKDNELIGYMIMKYSEQAAQNQGDYTVHVKLGNLYELLFDYKKAEEQYKKAINKSPYGVYSSYFGLANVYVKTGKFKEALNIVKQLKNTNHKPLLVAKGDFYMNIGDALWEKEKYEDALKQYQIAFFFFKKVDSEKRALAVSGIQDCYNKLASIYFAKRDMLKSIDYLETALLYKETPVTFYKLAILYKDFDPVSANNYMEKTYERDPGLINFDIYEEILLKLVSYYYSIGDDLHKELYQQKLKSMKSFQKRYVLTEKDVTIHVDSIKVKSNLFKTKKKILVKFKIENASKYDFNTLFVVVKLRHNDKSTDIFKQRYYSKKMPLKSHEESQQYKFSYSFTDKDDVYVADKVWLDFYVGKKENMRKIPVFSVEVKK